MNKIDQIGYHSTIGKHETKPPLMDNYDHLKTNPSAIITIYSVLTCRYSGWQRRGVDFLNLTECIN